MGKLGFATTASFLTVFVGFIGYLLSLQFVNVVDIEPLRRSQFWGPSALEGNKEDTLIYPHRIEISNRSLADLRRRLELELESLDERVADPLDGVGFQWGFNKNVLRKVMRHWLHKYDWRERETALNRWPSSTTTISGIKIHFQHIKPVRAYSNGTRPLLLLHGWPGSFVEYQEMIPGFLHPENSSINFEVVIPSLPGFGLSEGSSQVGLGTPEIGVIMKTLMGRLGHDRFYVQGGDLGASVSSDMGVLFPGNILGIHMSMCVSFQPKSILKLTSALVLPQLFLDSEDIPVFSPLSTYVLSRLREIGYAYLQATKPDTVGVALSHSPSALAAYIMDKFVFGTNPTWVEKLDGGLFPHYDINTMLDNVMVHWMGKSTTTFLRIYGEFLNMRTSTHYLLEAVPVEVAVSCRNYPMDPFTQPRFVLEDKYRNLVRFTRAKSGGHFINFENPSSAMDDIIASINVMDKYIIPSHISSDL